MVYCHIGFIKVHHTISTCWIEQTLPIQYTYPLSMYTLRWFLKYKMRSFSDDMSGCSVKKSQEQLFLHLMNKTMTKIIKISALNIILYLDSKTCQVQCYRPLLSFFHPKQIFQSYFSKEILWRPSLDFRWQVAS